MSNIGGKLQSARINFSIEAAETGSKISYLLVESVRSLESSLGKIMHIPASDTMEITTKLARSDMVLRAASNFDISNFPLWIDMEVKDRPTISILVANIALPSGDDTAYVARRINTESSTSPYVAIWTKSSMLECEKIQDALSVRRAAPTQISMTNISEVSFRSGFVVASLAMGAMAKAVYDLEMEKCSFFPGVQNLEMSARR